MNKKRFSVEQRIGYRSRPRQVFRSPHVLPEDSDPPIHLCPGPASGLSLKKRSIASRAAIMALNIWALRIVGPAME